jgi:hypothetical protein
MKDLFPEYYRPTEREFEQLWKDAIFVFDANVLLDIYRYTPSTSNELLNVMRKLGDRVWIPYQFAFEYHKNLAEVRNSPPSSYDEALSFIAKLKDDVTKQLGTLKNRTQISVEKWSTKIIKSLEQIAKEIAYQKQIHDERLKDNNIPDAIHEIFVGRIGREYTQQELQEIYKQGKERFALKQPPGFKDEKKTENPYGDLVGWFQIIEHATKTKLPIILVTRDESDEDWFAKLRGQTISPRPELIKEMQEKAQVGFYIYKPVQFLEWASKYIKIEVSDTAREEIKSVGETQDAVTNFTNEEYPIKDEGRRNSSVGKRGDISIAQSLADLAAVHDTSIRNLTAGMGAAIDPNIWGLQGIVELAITHDAGIRDFVANMGAAFYPHVSAAQGMAELLAGHGEAVRNFASTIGTYMTPYNLIPQIGAFNPLIGFDEINPAGSVVTNLGLDTSDVLSNMGVVILTEQNYMSGLVASIGMQEPLLRFDELNPLVGGAIEQGENVDENID